MVVISIDDVGCNRKTASYEVVDARKSVNRGWQNRYAANLLHRYDKNHQKTRINRCGFKIHRYTGLAVGAESYPPSRGMDGRLPVAGQLTAGAVGCCIPAVARLVTAPVERRMWTISEPLRALVQVQTTNQFSVRVISWQVGIFQPIEWLPSARAYDLYFRPFLPYAKPPRWLFNFARQWRSVRGFRWGRFDNGARARFTPAPRRMMLAPG